MRSSVHKCMVAVDSQRFASWLQGFIARIHDKGMLMSSCNRHTKTLIVHLT